MKTGISLRKVLSVLLELIFRSIFIGDDSWFRHSSIFVNIPAIALMLMICSYPSFSGCLYVLALLISLHLLLSSINLLTYASILALIPSLWYFVTTLPFTHSLYYSFEVMIRVFTSSIVILTAILTWNPMEIPYLISKATSRKEPQIFIPLLWKVIPHTLKDSEDALLSNELKGESLWRALAVTFVASIEYSYLYEESLHSKVYFFKPYYFYDLRIILLYIAIIVLCLNYIIAVNV